MPIEHQFVLTLACPDAKGIVHAVSGLLYQAGCNIIDSQQFGDLEGDDATGWFFMRVHFHAPRQLARADTLALLFQHTQQQFGMSVHFQALAGRAINIHRSFLPSFKRARPCFQAHARGVKRIGATAHDVTADLDEGPIVEQDVQRADHTLSAEDFTAVGRDIECMVLARAVRWHVEHRVLVNSHKCVVFR